MSDKKEDVVVAVEGTLDAVKLLVDNGADVTYNHVMLYKTGKNYFKS